MPSVLDHCTRGASMAEIPVAKALMAKYVLLGMQ